ncbi:MAG: hypothetical protein Kow0089_14120 [Desulfobulbaceae bacterium]
MIIPLTGPEDDQKAGFFLQGEFPVDIGKTDTPGGDVDNASTATVYPSGRPGPALIDTDPVGFPPLHTEIRPGRGTPQIDEPLHVTQP